MKGPQDPPLLSVSQVTVDYNRWDQQFRALDQVSFNAMSGEWIALTGPNGAGKSTLLKALMGLVLVERGQVMINGCPLNKRSSRYRAACMFMVHQSPLLGTAPLLSPLENLIVAGAPNRGEARTLLQNAGLGAQADQLTNTLSGGERQFLAILIAILRQPMVLLLDEPFSALDRGRERQCFSALSDFRLKGGTILQVTHQPRTLSGAATRELRMNSGRIVWDGPFEHRADAA